MAELHTLRQPQWEPAMKAKRLSCFPAMSPTDRAYNQSRPETANSHLDASRVKTREPLPIHLRSGSFNGRSGDISKFLPTDNSGSDPQRLIEKLVCHLPEELQCKIVEVASIMSTAARRLKMITDKQNIEMREMRESHSVTNSELSISLHTCEIYRGRLSEVEERYRSMVRTTNLKMKLSRKSHNQSRSQGNKVGSESNADTGTLYLLNPSEYGSGEQSPTLSQSQSQNQNQDQNQYQNRSPATMMSHQDYSDREYGDREYDDHYDHDDDNDRLRRIESDTNDDCTGAQWYSPGRNSSGNNHGNSNDNNGNNNYSDGRRKSSSHSLHYPDSDIPSSHLNNHQTTVPKVKPSKSSEEINHVHVGRIRPSTPGREKKTSTPTPTPRQTPTNKHNMSGKSEYDEERDAHRGESLRNKVLKMSREKYRFTKKIEILGNEVDILKNKLQLSDLKCRHLQINLAEFTGNDDENDFSFDLKAAHSLTSKARDFGPQDGIFRVRNPYVLLDFLHFFYCLNYYLFYLLPVTFIVSSVTHIVDDDRKESDRSCGKHFTI